MSNVIMNHTVRNHLAVVNGPDVTRSAQFDWMRGLVLRQGVHDGTLTGRDTVPHAVANRTDLLTVFEVLSRIPG